jgi:hypothetical protein
MEKSAKEETKPKEFEHGDHSQKEGKKFTLGYWDIRGLA